MSTKLCVGTAGSRCGRPTVWLCNYVSTYHNSGFAEVITHPIAEAIDWGTYYGLKEKLCQASDHPGRFGCVVREATLRV